MSSLPRINSHLRPIVLHGHDKSITTVKFNADGDLLFSACKNRTATVWYSETGVRLGTYSNHKGAIWDLDPSWDSQYLVTACGDANARLFVVTTGQYLCRMPHRGPVRAVKWSESNSVFATASDPLHALKETSLVSIFDFPAADILAEVGTGEDPAPLHLPRMQIPINMGDRATCIEWSFADEFIIVGTDLGFLITFNPVTGEEVLRRKVHNDRISRLTFNKEKTLLVTASKDCDAKLIDPVTLEVLKIYHTDRPVNGAVISPTHPHIIMGGGQEAINVTTTKANSGKFESRFFHMLLEEEFGRVKGHFGPINAMAVHPLGLSFASGSEDGYIRLHPFDSAYLNAPSLIPDDVVM